MKSKNLEQNKLFVDEIFKYEPEQWGLTGDIYLWRELKEKFSNIELPCTVEDFKNYFNEFFEELTGSKLKSYGKVYIKRYEKEEICNGYISLDFWSDEALPLLIQRVKRY